MLDPPPPTHPPTHPPGDCRPRYSVQAALARKQADAVRVKEDEAVAKAVAAAAAAAAAVGNKDAPRESALVAEVRAMLTLFVARGEELTMAEAGERLAAQHPAWNLSRFDVHRAFHVRA